jgi:hypothetical protein
MEFHCARTTRAGEHAPLGNEEMRNVTTRPKYGVGGERIEGSGIGRRDWKKNNTIVS